MKRLVIFGHEVDVVEECKVAGSVTKTQTVSTSTLTDEGKDRIVQEILDAMAVSVLGRVEGNGDIVLSLPKGTYALKYEMEDGTLVDICGVTVA